MAPPPPPPPPASFPAALCITLSLLLLARAGSAPSASRPRRGRRQAGTADAPEEQDRESSSNPTVILDSGASYHAAADRRCLAGFDTAAGCAGAVHRTRDGTELPAAGAGTLTSENFQLPDVLHIPGLLSGTVLVAVQLLARWGYLVMFGGGQCLVMDRTSGKLVGQGRLREDGLYRLDFLKIPPLNAAPAAAADGTDSNGVHGADTNVI